MTEKMTSVAPMYACPSTTTTFTLSPALHHLIMLR